MEKTSHKYMTQNKLPFCFVLLLVCQPVPSGTEEGSAAMRMVAVTYVYVINKYIEFMDTFFFVARKKDNQVTGLHVYHHAIMPVYAWIQMRWLPGGHEIVMGLVNCLVHIVMYTYYLLAALGPKMQPYLWWKRYLTVMQVLRALASNKQTDPNM